MTQSTELLASLSTAFADAVDIASPSVVQVHGAKRPASGVAYGPSLVLTTVSAIGREDNLRVRGPDGTTVDAELAGWDPATGLALLRAEGFNAKVPALSNGAARVGQIAIAVARSWSNAITASSGIVSVIGGPLPTGRRRSIEQVIRTTAPMHDGFAGGAFIDPAGALLGVVTSMRIRGTSVVIPSTIAWKAAAEIAEHGQIRRGFLGVAGQRAEIPEKQRREDRETGLLIVGLTPGGPAETAGILAGDILLHMDDHRIDSPDDLLDLLRAAPIGEQRKLTLLRGGSVTHVTVAIGERPKR